MHGDNRNFCTALVTLDEEAIRKWLARAGRGRRSAHDGDRPRSCGAEADSRRHRAGERGLASYETVKKFELLPVDFTIESGELTASLKLKRKMVEQKYKDLLDGFYSEANVRV